MTKIRQREVTGRPTNTSRNSPCVKRVAFIGTTAILNRAACRYCTCISSCDEIKNKSNLSSILLQGACRLPFQQSGSQIDFFFVRILPVAQGQFSTQDTAKKVNTQPCRLPDSSPIDRPQRLRSLRDILMDDSGFLLFGETEYSSQDAD